MAKKWLDNYGTKENENNSSVSLPEGFVGMGNNTKGRNYSPAWGGSFQMGGSVYPVNYVPQAQEGIKSSKVKSPRMQWAQEEQFKKNKENKKYEKSIDNLGEEAIDTAQHFIPGLKYFPGIGSTIGVAESQAYNEEPTTSDELGMLPFLPTQIASLLMLEAETEKENMHKFAENKYRDKDFSKVVPKKEYAMGGTIAGTPGFSYARTQGAAPSKGPHRNKVDVTDASAQNGKEMQYYQNGLDFQPKSISKNGSWLSKYDVAQKGIKIPDERDEAIVRKDVTPNFQPKIDTPLTAKQKEQIRLQKLREKQGEIRTHTPQSTSSRVKEVALNPLTAFGYAARNENLPENFSRGERNSLDMATDIINPTFYLNQADEAGENIGSSVSNIAQGNYPAAYRDIKNAGMNALNTLPLASEYKTIAKGAGQLGRALGTEEGLLSKVDNAIYPRRAYRASLPEGNVTSYAPSELASKISGKGDWATADLPESFQYLSKRGLLSGEDMALTEYKLPFWKKDVTFDPDVVALKQSQNAVLNPSEYIIPGNNPIDRFLYPRRTNMIKAVPESVKEAELLTPGGMSYKPYDPKSIPMSYQSPNLSSPAYKYIEDQLNAVTGHKMPITFEHNLQFESPRFNVPMDTYTQPTLPPNAGVGNFSRGNISTSIAPELRQGLRTAGPSFNNKEFNFIKKDLSEGNDIKYEYIDKSGNKVSTFSGKKGPEGFHVNSINVEPEFRRQGVASDIYKNIAKDLQSKNEGTLLSRSTQHQFTDVDELGRSVAPANKLWENLVNKGEAEKFIEGMSHSYRMKPLENGGVVKDDRGQWDHPGEITEISGDTMATHGYGDIPLYVVPDKGKPRMVQPNTGTQKFPGAKKFTEYPIAQNGLRQEQKSLQNLDNLTNFTNYNKPQPGGWLNKYN